MEGTLSNVPVAEVFQRLRTKRETGIVHLSQGVTTKRVYFRGGAIVFASSDESSERLGERLVRSGALHRADLDLACRATAASNRRLGATLVQMGYLSPEQLEAKVREQVTSIVESLFPWRSGSYRTELCDNPVDADLERVDLSTVDLLVDGVRRLTDAKAIGLGIGDLEAPLSHAADPSRLGLEISLTPEEGFVLSRVDGVTSAGEIAKLSPMGELETLRCIYTLLIAGLLRASGDTPMASKPARSPEAERFAAEMQEKLRRSGVATLYQLLDLEASATPDAVRAAYFRLAKRLHPDHRAGLKIEDPGGAYDDLYLKVKNAYEILSSETGRRRYDFSLQQKEEKVPSVPASAEPVAKAESAREATPKNTFSPAQAARIHFANGERYFADGRYHEAIEEIRAAVRIDPSKAEYHRLLGIALAKNPKWRKKAEEHFWKALEIDRFDALCYVELGDLYDAGGLATRAHKMYEEASAIDPDNARAREKLSSRPADASTLSKLKGIFGRH
jgi:tetratricopeptide (TPR) repeat protein